jgi:predicted component of type VI protein secretion system
MQIEWRAGAFWLQDLSVNGTWVNQARVADAVALQPGDLIAIGESVLQLRQ